MTWLAVVLLGASGATLRAVVTHRLSPLVGTAVVNVAASLLLGLTAGRGGVVGVGFHIGLLGALSTWSTLAYQLADLVRTGRVHRAAVYFVVTMIAGVGAAWAGLRIG